MSKAKAKPWTKEQRASIVAHSKRDADEYGYGGPNTLDGNVAESARGQLRWDATLRQAEAERDSLQESWKEYKASTDRLLAEAIAERDAWRTITQWVGGLDVPRILGFYGPGCDLDSHVIEAIKVIVAGAAP